MLTDIWRRRVKRGCLVCLLLISMRLVGAGAAGWQENPQALLPAEALKKLAESEVSDCSICVRQLQKEAFEILSSALEPGRVIQTSSTCRLRGDPLKASNLLEFVCQTARQPGSHKVSNAYPRVKFKFHTDLNHLVGIKKGDYTLKRFASLYQNAPPGALFAGKLEIISFAYGNGPSFMYLASERQVLIHCRIVDLRIQNH